MSWDLFQLMMLCLFTGLNDCKERKLQRLPRLSARHSTCSPFAVCEALLKLVITGFGTVYVYFAK